MVYPWATNSCATVQRIGYLLAEEIIEISGTVQCKLCEKQYEMGYDVRVEFPKILKYVTEIKSGMEDQDFVGTRTR